MSADDDIKQDLWEFVYVVNALQRFMSSVICFLTVPASGIGDSSFDLVDRTSVEKLSHMSNDPEQGTSGSLTELTVSSSEVDSSYEYRKKIHEALAGEFGVDPNRSLKLSSESASNPETVQLSIESSRQCIDQYARTALQYLADIFTQRHNRALTRLEALPSLSALLIQMSSPKTRSSSSSEPRNDPVIRGNISIPYDVIHPVFDISELSPSNGCSLLINRYPGLHEAFCRHNIHHLPLGAASEDFARFLIQFRLVDEAFFIVDIGKVIHLVEQWKALLPEVTPYYAVKCNPDAAIVAALEAIGCGFDCASLTEIALAIDQGISPDRIIYANPFKSRKYLQYARSVGVQLMTFDSIEELKKIKEEFPDAELVLRITTDDKKSTFGFSSKFGAPREHWEPIIRAVLAHGMHLVGVSFHVGTGCGDASSYATAIRDSKYIFTLAERLGIGSMYLVDIGGGYPGSDLEAELEGHPSFADIAATVHKAIHTCFSHEDITSRRIRFIGEPGRYLATRSHELYVQVYAKKDLMEDGGLPEEGLECEVDKQVLYIDDGVYQSFSGVYNDILKPRIRPLFPEVPHLQGMPEIKTKIFGQTCDSLDVVLEETRMPRLRIGDWLRTPDMGAYTSPLSTPFNGFLQRQVVYVCSDPTRWEEDPSEIEYSKRRISSDKYPVMCK